MAPHFRGLNLVHGEKACPGVKRSGTFLRCFARLAAGAEGGFDGRRLGDSLGAPLGAEGSAGDDVTGCPNCPSLRSRHTLTGPKRPEDVRDGRSQIQPRGVFSSCWVARGRYPTVNRS